MNGEVSPDEVVTPEDLAWWLDLAPRLTWIWAKTYADTAPHWYVVADRTRGISREEFVRAGRVIRTFGQPGRFYSMVNTYLVSPDGKTKWWTMDPAVQDTDLINQASTEKVYGVQDLPSTHGDAFTFYDSLASAYDDMWVSPADRTENVAVRSLIIKHFGAMAPTVLDIGAGTGLLLDLGITHPSLFTAVDPSQGMLNELIRKHPKVRNVVVKTMDQAIQEHSLEGHRFDLVCALFSVASYLKAETIEALPNFVRPGGLLLLMTYEDNYLPGYYETGSEGPTTRHQAQAACRALPLSLPEFKIGAFDVFMVTP